MGGFGLGSGLPRGGLNECGDGSRRRLKDGTERRGGEGFQGRFQIFFDGDPCHCSQALFYKWLVIPSSVSRVLVTRVSDIQMSIVRAPRCDWMFDPMYMYRYEHTTTNSNVR